MPKHVKVRFNAGTVVTPARVAGAVTVPAPTVDDGGSFDASTLDATNTGIAYSGLVKGDLGAAVTNKVFNTANEVYTNHWLNQDINITANNVTIRNCWIDASAYWPIKGTGTGAVFENCTVVGASPFYQGFGDFGDGWTIRRCNISGFENHVSFGGQTGTLIEYNWLHGIEGPDADVIEGYSMHDTLIQFNKITPDYTTTQPNAHVQIANYGGPCSSTYVFDNYFAAGNCNWGVYVETQFSGGTITDTRFLRNVFGTGVGFANARSDKTIYNTVAEIQANPSGILCPSSGADANHVGTPAGSVIVISG